ncbi:MAG: hypothetical protein ACM36C_02310 [Acidobacteriota bacterium]
MLSRRCRTLVGALTVGTSLVACPDIVSAQALDAFEITPFAGYRFGGDFFEIETGRPIDRDGAPAFGVLFDVPLSHGLQLEGLFTHQSADLLVPGGPLQPAARWRVAVDHYQVGGLQEFGIARIRPFLTGMFGLSRYGTAGDNEFRFSLGAGGGVKILPWSSIGFRLDGRLYATFVDFEGNVVLCGSGGCLLNLNPYVVWQAEFTAGLVVRFQ